MDMVPQGCLPPSYLEREDMVEIQLCRPCDLRKDDGTPSPSSCSPSSFLHLAQDPDMLMSLQCFGMLIILWSMLLFSLSRMPLSFLLSCYLSWVSISFLV